MFSKPFLCVCIVWKINISDILELLAGSFHLMLSVLFRKPGVPVATSLDGEAVLTEPVQSQEFP